MLSLVMLSVVMLTVVMLSAVATGMIVLSGSKWISLC
jgi:hypothetical protein